MEYVININASNFKEEVLGSSIPVAVYFYSDDCAQCLSLTPTFIRMAEKYHQSMKYVKIHRQVNRAISEEYNVRNSPTVIFFNEGKEVCSRLSGYIGFAELKEVTEKILGGTCTRKGKEKIHCDVAILGAGPAGLSAAIYAARAKLHVVIIDEGMPGGQVATTYHVANYPGTNGVVRGLDLVENMKRQALDFGALIYDLQDVKEVSLNGVEKVIMCEETEFYAKTVIIATGAQPRKLPASGENEFRGRGVHYCATCDGAMYQDADVIVVGGGDSALEEAMFLTRYVKKITILNRSEMFRASKAAQKEVFEHPDIEVVWNSQISKVEGDNFVNSVVIKDTKTGEERAVSTEGIFVYIGMEPKTTLFKGKVNMDDFGYIIAGEDMKTDIPGVFVAGDVRKKKIRQIATAVSDGVISGIMAERFITGRED